MQSHVLLEIGRDMESGEEMSSLNLTAVESRILGCLLEKERLTPENYPISLNSLVAACNQSTNRDPVVGYDERTVDNGVTMLREKKLAVMIHLAGARVQKYRHNLPEHYELSSAETALICVLLLRGPQTPGELRQRTERLHSFPSLESVEEQLNGLTKGEDPLVKLLPPRPGQKERRYVQLLSEEEPVDSVSARSYETPVVSAPAVGVREESNERITSLESEVEELKKEIRDLREEFAAFRKQFE